MCKHVKWNLSWCWVYFNAKEGEKEDQLTPLPLGKVRVCCWVIEVPAEHGFCTRMEIVGEHQR